MDNLTKKINMIDVLGMMLPGGLMLMLFEEDIGFLEFMSRLTGDQQNLVVWGVAFLMGSYLVGMLLHELGSMAEKLMWTNPITDPRIYGAVSAGCTFDPQKEKVDEKEKGKKCSITEIVTAVLVALPFAGIVYLAAGGKYLEGFALFAVVLTICALVVHKSYYERLRPLLKTDILLRNRKDLYQQEAAHYQTSKMPENTLRKLEIFNGFRTLARSMLAMFAVAQTYAFVSQGANHCYIAQLDARINDSPALLFLRYLMVLTLVCRYWHFSCLYYQYRFAFLQAATKKGKKADAIKDGYCVIFL